ncbi:MAG: helix-turn-helix transcriptional regulator [Pyrinomonadaceae bacterium]
MSLNYRNSHTSAFDDTGFERVNTRVFNQLTPRNVGELGSISDTALTKLAQNRRSPGLLVLTADGDVQFMNSTAKQYLTREEIVDRFLTELRRQVLSQPKGGVTGPAMNLPVVQLLFFLGESWYVVRGFWLESAGNGSAPVMGIVIESINLTRLDMDRARKSYKFSPREITIVQALSKGQTDKEIALILKMSPETVRWHLKAIRTKMGVRTRTAIVHKLLLP